MLDAYNTEELRKVFDVVPERVYNYKIALVPDRETLALVVFARHRDEEIGEIGPDLNLASSVPFLIEKKALVSFARQVLEHLDPSPELATLQRIETLLEERLPEKSCDTS